ncbi:hypothetical protein BC939DRAFT_436246 [Gamsiella multidivaricata]|uniref:uncharacterized protein n=1 Tax=Gamsiella multidivaricata TaxID=101098 RepID=UPI00221E4256|nr:uncharacterized protein BC939DRAFT_436246 [Gamsiella multidivaricata]KAI7831720.1 hypothetical protein BC939DRAFT_436246 [Gamsiella multidivaricata]
MLDAGIVFLRENTPDIATWPHIHIGLSGPKMQLSQPSVHTFPPQPINSQPTIQQAKSPAPVFRHTRPPVMPHNITKRPAPQEPEQQGAIADCLSGSAPFRYAAVFSAEAPEETALSVKQDSISSSAPASTSASASTDERAMWTTL